MTVSGAVDPAFAGVAGVLGELLATGAERGAAVAAAVDGRLVVDLWGGTADEAGRPWRADTLVNVYSAGKPVAAACLLLLVDRGRIGLDTVVAEAWPEFGAAGKETITVRQVLAHQAGLDLFEEPLAPEALLDWERATALLASSPPRWRPGSTHGEHAAFYGHLVGELVRRLDGRSIGRFLREELAEPWGLELAFGLPDGELGRVADLVDPGGAFAAEILAAGETYRLALDNPRAMLDVDVVNGRAWRAAAVPAVGCHATARGLATLYAGLAAGGALDGRRLLAEELVREAVGAPQLVATDEVLGRVVGWGLGVQVDDEGFGMGGIGGNAGWWSNDGYAFAYVTRRLGSHGRAFAAEAALRDALGLPPHDDA